MVKYSWQEMVGTEIWSNEDRKDKMNNSYLGSGVGLMPIINVELRTSGGIQKGRRGLPALPQLHEQHRQSDLPPSVVR